MANNNWRNGLAGTLVEADDGGVWGPEGYEQSRHMLRFALPLDDQETPPSGGQLAMLDAYVLISKLVGAVLALQEEGQEKDARVRLMEEKLARLAERLDVNTDDDGESA